MSEQYVHGYRDGENRRLHDQATTLIDLLHRDTGYPPASSVLEVGCGVGAQTVAVAERSPNAVITSIDISAESLVEAQRQVAASGHDAVSFIHADVFDLPTRAVRCPPDRSTTSSSASCSSISPTPPRH